MSLFGRSEVRAAWTLEELLSRERGGGRTAAGVAVTLDSSMRLATVWACVNLLGNLVSTLPLDGVKSVGEVRRPVDPTPRLLASPSAVVPLTAWLYQVVVSLKLRGNAFGIIVARDAMGFATQIELVHPDAVSVKWVSDAYMMPAAYRIHGKEYRPDQIWHVAENLVPGSPLGLSTIEYARQMIGMGLAAEKFGAEFFGDGGHPTAILKSDREIDQKQAETIKERFLKAVRGNREPAVLGLGVEYQQIQVAANESQFLETQQFTGTQTAVMFGVPPELVGQKSGDSSTYANVESRALWLLTTTLGPTLVRIEEALSAQLVPGTAAKFREAALLRTDTKTRYELADLSIRGGWKSRDEWRAKDDLEPIPDGTGGEFLWPPYTVTPTPPEAKK